MNGLRRDRHACTNIGVDNSRHRTAGCSLRACLSFPPRLRFSLCLRHGLFPGIHARLGFGRSLHPRL